MMARAKALPSGPRSGPNKPADGPMRGPDGNPHLRFFLPTSLGLYTKLSNLGVPGVTSTYRV